MLLIVLSSFVVSATETKEKIDTRSPVAIVKDWEREPYIGIRLYPNIQEFTPECIPGYCVETQYKEVAVQPGYTLILTGTRNFFNPNPAVEYGFGGLTGYRTYYYTEYIYKVVPE